jgi:hypothetical protein
VVSQPLLIDQHTGSATYIETMHDEFIFEFIKWKQIHDMYDDYIFNHLANAMHFDFVIIFLIT